MHSTERVIGSIWLIGRSGEEDQRGHRVTTANLSQEPVPALLQALLRDNLRFSQNNLRGGSIHTTCSTIHEAGQTTALKAGYCLFLTATLERLYVTAEITGTGLRDAEESRCVVDLRR